MYTALGSLCVLFWLLLHSFVVAFPIELSHSGNTTHAKPVARRGLSLPLQRRKIGRRNVETLLVGSIGVGDVDDSCVALHKVNGIVTFLNTGYVGSTLLLYRSGIQRLPSTSVSLNISDTSEL